MSELNNKNDKKTDKNDKRLVDDEFATGTDTKKGDKKLVDDEPEYASGEEANVEKNILTDAEMIEKLTALIKPINKVDRVMGSKVKLYASLVKVYGQAYVFTTNAQAALASRMYDKLSHKDTSKDFKSNIQKVVDIISNTEEVA